MLLIFSGAVPPASANPCELYPIAFSWSTLTNASVGQVLADIQNGAGPGNFGWLSWNESVSAPDLAASLTPPGDSQSYTNPEDSNDGVVHIGDWVPGKPGVVNRKAVRDALDSLKAQDCVVPVWDQTRGQGKKTAYRVATFARVRLLNYQLPDTNRITAQFLGFVTCGIDNHPPTVDAGPAQAIKLGDPLKLTGVASDDGYPVGGRLTVVWSQVSGSGSVRFENAIAATTMATPDRAGVYVLRLTATDSETTNSADVTITVRPPNEPPVVEAGPNVTNFLGTPLTLSGSVTDDGAPPGASVTAAWSVVGGPGAVTFSDRNAPVTVAQFSAPGDYRLRLTADDTELSSSDDLMVTVVQPNRPPSVSAGQNLWVKLPNTATLNGAVSDDGLPLGGALSVAWSKISGPGTATFADAANPRTSAAFDAAGNYVLRLSASDSELTTTADITIIVSAAAVNEPPIVSAGPDQVVGLTNVAALNGVVTDDGLPAGIPLVIAWSQASGPATVTFEQPAAAKTKAIFNQLGTYVLRLSASDSEYTVSRDVTITVYPSNTPPVVEAGPNQTITVPDPAVLTLTGIEPTNTSQALAPSVFAAEHWTNRVGQPGLTGVPPGAYFVTVAQQSVATSGNNLFVGGKFLQAGGQTVNGLARWDGANWFSLYDASPSIPTNPASPPLGFVTDTALPITAVAARGHEVFVGGGFLKDLSWPRDGQMDLTARWTGSNWVAWSFKLLSPVVACNTIVAAPDAVYVGGSFKFQPTNFATGTLTNLPISFNFARWDGTNWSTLGDGVRDVRDSGDPRTAYNYALVGAIAVGRTGEVYAAGSFVMDTPTGRATNIAKWNGQQWAPLGGGLAGCNAYYTCSTRLYALAITDDGTLYAGGDFTIAGDAAAYHVARWNGTRWSPLLSGMDNGLTASPVALAAHGHDVYLAGMFGRAGGVAAAGIAKWNGQFWTALGTGSTNGVYGSVASLAVNARGLFVGGQFNQAGGLAANNIAQWAFPPLPSETVYLRGSVTDDDLPTGATLEVTWSKLSGPGDVAFADPHVAATTAKFSRAGAYVLRLAASDTDLASFDDTTVVIQANEAPVVDAGVDQAVGLSEAAVLNGSVADDGLPTGATVAADWSVMSGPAPVNFGDAHSPSTTATFGAIGTYVLRLSANDAQFSAFDETVVTVQPANTPPYVQASIYGPVTIPNPATLNGYARDDGLPIGKTTVAWSQVSGPAPAQFANANAAVTTASFSVPGNYVFAFTAHDSELATRADVTLQVLGNAVTNTDPNSAPAVNAGPDLSLPTRQAAHMNGSVIDDGLPAGALVTTYWSVVSGPGRVYFGDAGNVTTTATFSTPGNYVLRLTANDSRLSASDDAVVTVFTPTNEPPLVFAGLDTAVVRPDVAHLFGTALDDGLPVGHPLQVAWTQVTGPGIVTFTPSPNDLFADAAFSAPGSYVLRLSAGDSQFNVSDEITVDVQNGVNTAPVVEAGPSFAALLFGDSVLNATVSDDGLPGGTLETSWSQVAGPAPAEFSTVNGLYHVSFTAPGDYVLRFTANDSELSGSDDVAVTVYDVAEPPRVFVSSPGDGESVTAPAVFHGTASSPILQSWSLAYRLQSSESVSGSGDSALRLPPSAFTCFAASTNSVDDGPLATFDPTLLLNGLYEIQLTATDLTGRSSSTNFTVVVERNLKIGNFTLAFNDLTLPFAGLPIQVLRTYDSRDKRASDFGVGWSLSLKNIRLQKNRHLGRNWQETSTGGDFPVYTIDSPKPRIVTITFPDGKVYKFQAVPAPRVAFAIPIDYPIMDFVPLGPTIGSLTPATGKQLVFGAAIPGSGDFIDWELLLDPPPGPADNILFNPTLFEFTSAEGYVYLLDEQDGLHRVTDPNGNSLTVTTNGLIHSSGQSVLFQRDDQGRITNIVDPSGYSLAYHYDTNGDLVTFIDRENNTNGFTYDGRHDLLTLTDPRGVQPLRNEYDDAGRLVRHIDAFGKGVNYQHDLRNRQEILTDRLGNTTVHEYDERGNVVRTTDANGGVTSFGYDLRDNLIAQTNALGQATRYTYDDLDNRTSATDPLGDVTRFTYGPMRRILTATDPRGNSITNTYDDHGSLVTLRDPLGNFTRFAYDERGLPTAMTNALGEITRYAYDAGGNLTNETDPLGHATAFTRDPNGNLTAQTTTRTKLDPNGLPVTETLATHFAYDRQGRLTNTVFPDGSTTATIYNNLGKPAVTFDQLGYPTSYDYDALGQLVRTVYPDGSSDGSTYDAEGRLLATTNRLGRVIRYDYDALGRLVRTAYPDGTISSNYYDLAGQTIATTDARTNTAWYGYDDAGRTIAVTNALGYVSTNAYDAAGNLVITVDALGHLTRYVYDPLNRRTQTLLYGNVDPASPLRSPSYRGELLPSSFLGSADPASAGSGGIPEPLSLTTAYDALGRRVAQKDQAGVTTWFGYDALGRLTSVTNALGGVTRYDYDELGERVAQTDANQHVTRFDYDTLGHRTRRMLPGGQSETFGYDLAGNLAWHTDFNGFTTSFAYDALGRLLQKTPDARLLSADSAPVVFTYNALGQRLSMADPSGQTTYAYDDRDRLATKTVTWGRSGASLNAASVPGSAGVSPAQFSVSLNYSYDPNGNLVSIQSSDPNGASVAYEHDALNRLSAVNDATLGRTEYRYDPVGNVASTINPNGLQTASAYDSLNRLTNLAICNLKSQICNSFAYVLDPAGNRLSEQLTADYGPRTVSYSYDALYRLKAESIVRNPQVTTFEYVCDPVGNRLSKQWTTDSGQRTTGYAYDTNDRLTSDTYDPNGNTLQSTIGSGPLVSGNWPLSMSAGPLLTSLPPPSPGPQPPFTDTYDFENRLTARHSPLSTLRFFYDGDGNRVSKTVTTGTNTVTTFYLVDDLNPTGYPQVLEELTLVAGSPSPDPSSPTPTPQLSRIYSYGTSLISEDQLLTNQWVVNFYGLDGHGSVRFLTDALGQVTDAYDYDAFGNLMAQAAVAQAPTPNLYLFGGEQFDPDLGLYYLRARYLNPATGRFWTMDTFAGSPADPLSLHQYAYCANNPVNRVDPSGNESLPEISFSTTVGAGLRFGLLGGAFEGLREARLGGDYLKGFATGFASGFAVGALLGPLPATAWQSGAGPWLLAVLSGIGGSVAVNDAWGGHPDLAAINLLFSVAPWALTSRELAILFRQSEATKSATQLEFDFVRNLENPKFILYKAREFDTSMLRAGEYTLNLPNLGNAKLNWAQNEKALQRAMNIGKPIREMNPFAEGGFLQHERDFLRSHGWQRFQQGNDFYWSRRLDR